MADMNEHRRVNSWGELLEKMVDVGLGAATLTAETAQKIANDLVARGQVTAEESTGLVDRLLSMGHKQRDLLNATVEKATETVLDRMHLARQSEVDQLRQRIEALERLVLKPTTPCAAAPRDAAEMDYLVDQE